MNIVKHLNLRCATPSALNLLHYDLSKNLFVQRSTFHSSPLTQAGHSKWANIRHIKGANDAQRSFLIARHCMKIRLAIKEGGGTNPVSNVLLAKAIESAKMVSVPNATIDKVLESYTKAATNSSKYTAKYSGPSASFLVVDYFTDKPNHMKHQIFSVLRKFGMKELKGGSLVNIFEEKGILVASAEESPPIEKAEEHAIEVGCEDVSLEGDDLKFVCDPPEFYKVKKGLEDLDYSLLYAEVDLIPLRMANFSEEDGKKYSQMVEKLEELEEILKVQTNF